MSNFHLLPTFTCTFRFPIPAASIPPSSVHISFKSSRVVFEIMKINAEKKRPIVFTLILLFLSLSLSLSLSY